MKSDKHTDNCLYCKTPLLKKAWRKFCSQPCRKAFNNRRATRGAILYDLCMKWRKHRKETNGFANLCHQIGIFITDDTAMGITSYHDYPQQIPWQIPKSEDANGGGDTSDES